MEPVRVYVSDHAARERRSIDIRLRRSLTSRRVGEVLHAAGRDGAIRAKQWLERTTRVSVSWVNPDAVEKLTFSWLGSAGTFSFDLGGQLRGGNVHGDEFFAEVKKYGVIGDQPALYDEYLAKCYRTYVVLPARCDHFFWITWHPFSVTKWPSLCGPSEVRRAVLVHRERCLGEPDESAAEELVDQSVCDAVAARLWMIVLSDKQEDLVVENIDLDAVLARQRTRHT